MKDVSKDPEVDSSQDYRLLLGYENKTHTVLRFSRRYDTCDSRDLKITLERQGRSNALAGRYRFAVYNSRQSTEEV
ncbi:hypothetical protein M0804_010608 [Polistes exclamans]|nr:hypothetical protein M0804_010608 [Polistes exclamans]